MKKIVALMLASLEKIEQEGLLLPPAIAPPAKSGTRDLGELPDELKFVYTLTEFFLAEIAKIKVRPEKQRNQNLLSELEMRREIATAVYRFRFQQKYGQSELLSVYSDWHVYQIRLYFG